MWTPPIGPVVINNAAQTLLILLRDAGSISGKVWPPDSNPGAISLGSGSLAAGLTVQLQNITTNALIETISSNTGSFSFSNLTPATYRLRIATPPPGYIADNEPLITYQSSQILSGNNLHLVPTGHVMGVVYNDSNGNQQWDGNEPGIDDYAVRLVGSAGQEVAVAVPDADGYFRFGGLSANTPYALQLLNAPTAVFITAPPGIFTVGIDPMIVQLGISVEFPPSPGDQWVGGKVQIQQGEAQIPIAGARLIHYAPVNGSCNVANPLIMYDSFTDLQGNYEAQGAGGCFKVVDVPGYNDSPGYSWGFCPVDSTRCFLINGWHGTRIDITLTPVTQLIQANFTSTAQVSWAAFRDDNGNQRREAGEPGLAGVELAGSGVSGISGQTGWGQPLSLGDGLHTLTIAPPAGYVVNGPATRQISLQGSHVALPATPLRPAGLTIVQAFIDLDGDGEQDEGETGVGGVEVALSGAAYASATTTPNGRLMFADLPDGNYTVIATPPGGYAAVPVLGITLSQGGVLQIPLELPGMVSGVLYDDWDGDSQQQPDELVFRMPFTLTLGAEQMETIGGRGFYLGLPGGVYTLAATTTIVKPQSFTLAAQEGRGFGLAAVARGVVRGTLWLDANGDGLRQP